MHFNYFTRKKCFIIFILNLFNCINAKKCPSDNIIDVTSFSQQLQGLRKTLGGHTDVDLWFPQYKYSSPFGQFVVSDICDLECYDFDAFLTKPCRWRNENNGCSGDELDFIRMRGRWDKDEGGFLFSKQDTPDGFFLIVGTEKKMLSEHYSAMLISDPIQCQEGDGVVTLRHWTTPSVHVRVCIRQPSKGKQYDWCSEKVKRNGTNSAKVVIPGSILYTFEIVIEAYNFVFNTFGKEGGMAVIDDISYNSSAIYQCAMIPHIDPLPSIDERTCRNVRCYFEDEECVMKMKGTGWKTSNQAEGSYSTGIRKKLEGRYAFVRGPGTFSFRTGEISLSAPVGLEFCYYVASYKAAFRVYTKVESRNRTMIFDSSLNTIGHQWQCEKHILIDQNYEYIEFVAEKISNEHIRIGLDQIDLVNLQNGASACSNSLKKFDFNFFIN